MNSSEKQMCCGEEKMCALTCCPCSLKIEKIVPLANAPKFICKTCGRVANEAKNLCQPEPLN